MKANRGHHDTNQREKSLMNMVAPFIPKANSSKLVKRQQGTFYYSGIACQFTSILCLPIRDQGKNRTHAQLATMGFRTMSVVALNDSFNSGGYDRSNHALVKPL
jgi:hypothetical protein